MEEPGHRYEILKIWVPTHGVINIYRSPQGVYQVDNGCLLETHTSRYGIEKMRILASHGSEIEITRDRQISELQNKYTIDPPTLAMDVSAVRVRPINR